MTVAAGYYYYRYNGGEKYFSQNPVALRKKTLPAAVKMTNSASVAKFSAPTGKRTPQNPAEFQSLAAGLRIAQSETKYFPRKTFLFAKITTFTNTAFAKKMVL